MEKQLTHRGLITVVALYMKYRLKEIDAKPMTIRNYQVRFNTLVGYLGISSDKMIDDIDFEFAMDYRDYLANHNQKITQVSRNIEFVKAALEYAVNELEILDKNPLRKYKSKRDQVGEITYLTKEELHNVLAYRGKFETTKDMFILQCYTGMSFGDLWSYEIHTDGDGDWIYNKRNKTDKRYWVPLEGPAKEICIKYNYRFPFINNADYNEEISIVTKAVGITRHITSHDARRTFATTMFNDGWSVESLSIMMGITVPVLTQRYINISKMRVAIERRQRKAQLA